MKRMALSKNIIKFSVEQSDQNATKLSTKVLASNLVNVG